MSWKNHKESKLDPGTSWVITCRECKEQFFTGAGYRRICDECIERLDKEGASKPKEPTRREKLREILEKFAEDVRDRNEGDEETTLDTIEALFE
jgi:hypothetical protein